MASVTTPSGERVRSLTGFNRYITGEATDDDLESWLEESIIPDAVVETALQVGETFYDKATHTARVAAALANAVCWRAAALALISPGLQKVTGTQEPLLMEDGTSITDLVDWLVSKARRLESAAVAGVESRPTAIPRCSSSTFSASSTDRTPGERIDLQDERDDVSAEDTENG